VERFAGRGIDETKSYGPRNAGLIRQRCRSIDVQPPQSFNELIEVERALSWGTDRVTELSYAVASAHETENRRATPQPY
jgi:hypothetical protein